MEFHPPAGTGRKPAPVRRRAFSYFVILTGEEEAGSRVGSFTADWERFFEVLPHGHRAARARV